MRIDHIMSDKENINSPKGKCSFILCDVIDTPFTGGVFIFKDMERLKHTTKDSGVYKIVSKINGKVYIGSAIHFENRWRYHKCDLRKNRHHSPYLQKHYNKYGEDDLIFKVIKYVIRKPNEPLLEFKERLLLEEQFYLDVATVVFNSCKIAGNCIGRTVSEETREKIRKKLIGVPGIKGRHPSEETRKKIGKASEGNQYCLGHVTPQDVCDKISEGNKKYWNTPEGKQRLRDRANKWWASPAGLLKKEKMKHNFLSTESRMKISKTLKDKYKNGRNPII